jgi:spore germination cell wall hydrolase CwlJ-like protein
MSIRSFALIWCTALLLPLSIAKAESLTPKVTIMNPVAEKDERQVPLEEVRANLMKENPDEQVEFTDIDFSDEYEESENTNEFLDLNSPNAIRDIECLTEAMYFESVGEPELGQVAVANVIMNRANWNMKEREPHERHRIEFNGGICDVVAFKISRTYKKPIVTKNNKKKWVHRTYTTCAFSYRCEKGFRSKLQRVRQKDSWKEINELAKETYIRYNSGENVDPSKGATFYHADYVAPWWRKAYQKTTKIGAHIFYRIE